MPAFAHTDDLAHKKALELSNANHYEAALELITPLARKHAGHSRFFYDYIAILHAAKKHTRVIAESKSVSMKRAPRYVLTAIAQSYRELKQFKQAENVYRPLHQRFPNNLDSSLGLALVLIDQGKFKAASTHLTRLGDTHPRNIYVLSAVVYLHEAQNKHLQALPIIEQLITLQPNNPQWQRKKIIVLNQIGASHLAYELAQKNVQLISTEEFARIKADKAAHRLRWSGIQPPDIKDRYKENDIAISELEQNIQSFNTRLGKSHLITLNEQFDLLVALRQRVYMQQVIGLYSTLIQQNVTIPPYAKNAVCDAWLYLEQPSKAETCYEDVINSGYQNVNTQVALFYAYLENEKYNKALSWIKEVASKQPVTLQSIGKKKIVKPNYKKAQTDINHALAIAFGDDLKAAHSVMNQFNQIAPYSLSIRKELANIYYWRGWPRKAQEEYDISLHQNPKDLGLKLGQARNYLALKQYPQADSLINTLYQAYPEDKGAIKQQTLWGIHNMRELQISVGTDKSNGGTNGSRGLGIDATLYSAPYDYHYRAFIHARHQQAEFTEGDGLLNHAGIGLEYRAPDIALTGELHHNRFDNNRVGFQLTGQYTFNDNISTSASFDTLSQQTPLRALNQGIYAKSLSLGSQYRWHEERTVGVNASTLKFSDGNRRKSLGAFWNERWYNQHNYKFSTRIDLFSSKNSKNNVIYFNPKQDFSAGIAFENDWLTWRRYEDNFHQRLILSTGIYKQKQFSRGNTWGVQYEHRWVADHRFELAYGIKRNKNLYDGQHELNTNLYLTLNWKF